MLQMSISQTSNLKLPVILTAKTARNSKQRVSTWRLLVQYSDHWCTVQHFLQVTLILLISSLLGRLQ